jgi:hypothetical protein
VVGERLAAADAGPVELPGGLGEGQADRSRVRADRPIAGPASGVSFCRGSLYVGSVYIGSVYVGSFYVGSFYVGSFYVGHRAPPAATHARSRSRATDIRTLSRSLLATMYAPAWAAVPGTGRRTARLHASDVSWCPVCVGWVIANRSRPDAALR